MASLSCSFVAHSQKNCDTSKGYPGDKEFFPLTSCKKHIRSHLRTIKVGQTSLPTERDLILAHTGHFREDGANMTICPAHRAELGIFWRPRRKCAHSLHGNRKSKPGRVAKSRNMRRNNGKGEHTQLLQVRWQDSRNFAFAL